MSDAQTPSSAGQGKGSLWTTPASAAASHSLDAPLVDKAVSAETIRAAVAATKARAEVFSGRVSDEVLRTSVE